MPALLKKCRNKIIPFSAQKLCRRVSSNFGDHVTDVTTANKMFEGDYFCRNTYNLKCSILFSFYSSENMFLMRQITFYFDFHNVRFEAELNRKLTLIKN